MMKIVLLERVPKLGQMGDIVDVKSGYARNFLLPLKKALRATEQNIKIFEEQKTILKAKNLENIKEAKNIKSKLDGKSFVLIRSASETGALYGSVSSKDIKEAASIDGIDIVKNQIILDKPIKDLGIYKINIKLHPDVTSVISINVARTEEEAILQEKGSYTTKNSSAEEQTTEEADIKNMFEDETMAEKIGNEDTGLITQQESNDSKKDASLATSDEKSDEKSVENIN